MSLISVLVLTLSLYVYVEPVERLSKAARMGRLDIP
jgi:hypothetical protein